MTDSGSHIPDINFVDTPEGIFTATGNWFRATKGALVAYAGPVFEHESLDELIDRAEIWLRSPETLVLWLLPVFLLVIEPVPATLSGLTVYVAWKALGPSLMSLWAARVLELLDKVWLQGIYYVGILSYSAAVDNYTAVWIGLVGFVLLRWGIVARIAGPVVRLIWASLYQLPIADQILRGFILRAAVKYRVSLPQLHKLERQILDMFSKT